jgi:hypothetical protein
MCRLCGGTAAIVVLIGEATVDRPKWMRRSGSTTSSTPTHIYIGLSAPTLLLLHCVSSGNGP